MSTIPVESPVSNFSRLSTDLSDAAKAKAESPLFASVRAPKVVRRMEGIEEEFDAALHLLKSKLPDPFQQESITTMVGKTEVHIRDLRLTGLATLRRLGQVLYTDEDEFNLRKTATHLCMGPVKITFKLIYGTRKRRMEVTASSIRFGVRVKADKSRQEMKLDKLTMEPFDLKMRLLGEKAFDPMANIMLVALHPMMKRKARQVLKNQIGAQVKQYQDKTKFKMIRMLYGIKEKPWSGLEGKIPFRKSKQ